MAARPLHRQRRGPRRRPLGPVGHHPERHREGVPVPGDLHLPARSPAAGSPSTPSPTPSATCPSGTRSTSAATTCKRPGPRPTRRWPTPWPPPSASSTPCATRARSPTTSSPRWSAGSPSSSTPGCGSSRRPARCGPSPTCGTGCAPSATGSPTPSSGACATACRSTPSGLTEAQPENNVPRIVLESLGVTLSKRARARALQLPAWNEALGLPRPWDQQWSLRIQQILAFESDLLEYGDIFDGSVVIEKKTAEVAEASWAELEDVLAAGRGLRGHRRAEVPPGGQPVRAGTPHRDRRAPGGRRQLLHRDGRVAPVAGERTVERGRPPIGSILRVDPAVESELRADVEAWRRRPRRRPRSGAPSTTCGGRPRAPTTSCRPPSPWPTPAGPPASGPAPSARCSASTGPPPGSAAGSATGAPSSGRCWPGPRPWPQRAGGPPRLLVAKPGLDGHSNGAEQIAVAARDAGFEVVYQGIRLSPAEIAAAARDEDVDVVGISILSGSHLELVPEVVDRLRAAGVDAPVVVGGIIPPEDAEILMGKGVARVYTPKDFEIGQMMDDMLRPGRGAPGRLGGLTGRTVRRTGRSAAGRRRPDQPVDRVRRSIGPTSSSTHDRPTGYVPDVAARRDPMAGILSGPIDAPPEDRLAKVYPRVPAAVGMALTHRASGFSGTLVRIEGGGVEIRGRTGLERVFRLTPGAFIGRRAGRLAWFGRRRRPPGPEPPAEHHASGSVAVPGSAGPGGPGRPPAGSRASTTPSWSSGCGATTCGSRAWWWSGSTGSTTWRRPSRSSGRARPGSSASWSTTWSTGSKESRIAAGLRHPDVLVTGTPFVDVWQAVRPSVLGIEAWPQIPMGTRLEDRGLRGPRVRGSPDDLAADPRLGQVLRRPGAGPGGRGRTAHRLRDRPPTDPDSGCRPGRPIGSGPAAVSRPAQGRSRRVVAGRDHHRPLNRHAGGLLDLLGPGPPGAGARPGPPRRPGRPAPRGRAPAGGRCPGSAPGWRRVGSDGGQAHSGMFPCLRLGRSSRLDTRRARLRTRTRRVSAGSMTSST